MRLPAGRATTRYGSRSLGAVCAVRSNLQIACVSAPEFNTLQTTG